MEQLTLPSIDVIAFIVIIAGAVSWGGVEVFKKAIAGLLKYHKIEHQPWWYDSFCRLMSCFLGALSGYLLCSDDRVICSLMGFASGALNAFIIMMLKKYLKKKVDQ